MKEAKREFVFEIGSVPVYGEKRGSIFLKAEIKGKEKPFMPYSFTPEKFSISGVIGPMRNGDALGSCGQINDTVREHLEKREINFAKGWDRTKTFQLLEIWDEHHLNDLKAGCEHQRAAKWEDVRIDPAELPNSHANRDEKGILAMWVYPKETGKEDSHEKGLLTKPCEVCGYKFGTAWKTAPLPLDLLKTLERFQQSLRVPAWV